MQSAFTEIESTLKSIDLERENQRLKEKILRLQQVNGGFRGANKKLKKTIKQLRNDN